MAAGAPGADGAFDVVVIGGGPAGSAAATTLAADGRSVLVVDDGGGERTFRVGEGAPPGLDRAVDQVFGPGAFVPRDHLPSYGNRSSWGADEPVDTDFMFNPFGLGWHLDRVAFDRRLRERARSAGAVTWEGVVRIDDHVTAPAAVDGVRIEPWTLPVETSAGGREVTAAVVIDATGRRAAFARRAGARLVTHDRLVAAVAIYVHAPTGEARHVDDGRAPTAGHGRPPVADDLAHATGSGDDLDTATAIEAAADGWWYSAAIPGGRRVVALFTDGDLVDPALRTVGGFTERLATTRHIGALVGRLHGCYRLPELPKLLAAGTTHLDRPVGPGWLAAGDAAACFDPLSSQGTLTAVLMGRTAGDAAISLLVDPRAGADAYEQRYRTIVDRYLVDQRETYALERRWPDAPFWARRLAGAVPPDR